jgi:hypothetical protein
VTTFLVMALFDDPKEYDVDTSEAALARFLGGWTHEIDIGSRFVVVERENATIYTIGWNEEPIETRPSE